MKYYISTSLYTTALTESCNTKYNISISSQQEYHKNIGENTMAFLKKLDNQNVPQILERYLHYQSSLNKHKPTRDYISLE